MNSTTNCSAVLRFCEFGLLTWLITLVVTLSEQYFDLVGMFWDPMQPVLLSGYNSTVVNIGTTITTHFASTFVLVILNPEQRDSPSTQFAFAF